ncbi:MAG: PSD1 and planctomycete cytochrome C domain-containing protein [Acidobacteriota bacterium]|nr:PSD1 and planctomycete cytochrome C domain-containing protein [Acidobacteriota bacterium]
MARTHCKLMFIWLVLFTIAAERMSAQSVLTIGDDFFERKIRPVLATNCYGCHASKMKSPMGGLALDTKSGLLKGGDSGPVIVPGKPAESLLLRAMRYSDPKLKMPPANRLADAVIADFEQWIAAGAPDPRVETVAVTAKPRGIDFDKGRQWWAFQPVREIAAPNLRQTSWPRTKVDRFILAKLEQNKLTPSAEADARTLILRATLDLTGLKPSYEEVESFANDKDPRRYEKLIDRLLASPRYGERWGRYWLDVARYAENGDTGGNRQAYPYAWRYRDWVIEAVNNDLPYDRFIKQQLAADLMPGTSRNDLRALGYLGMAPSEWKEKKLSKELIDNLLLEEWDERVDAVGRGMLGLSVACARCHDHKFDPISQKDYYALAGIFASTSPAIRPLREIDPATETKYLAARHRVTELNGLLGFLTEEKTLDQGIAKPKAEACRAEMNALKDEMKALQEQYPELVESVTRIGAPRNQANAGKPKPDPKALAAAAAKRAEEEAKAPFINAVHDAAMDSDGSYADYTPLTIKPGVARDLPVFARGNSAAPGEIVPRHFLTVLSKNTPSVFKRGSGRLELAEKILTDAAPLSARVIVNRVWGWHFGKHLVTTPSDFGDRGERPTHPELLDDLTARFIANGWSLKWLHREIMLSATYRQASKPRPEAALIDEENKWMWRMQPRRLDAEAIRDCMLQAAGKLNLEMYGPSLNLDNLDNTRRTVYGRINRGGSSDILRLYDFPNPFQHSPSRNLTITPLQELFVLNSPFIKQLSSALAKAVEADADATTRVRNLYRKILLRDPNAAEIKVALSYLNSATSEQLAQVLLATNEEVFWP